MKLIRLFFSVGLLSLGCSAEDPTSVSHTVTEDGACHQLLLLQCTCCGNGEPNCTAGINDGVRKDTLEANLSDAQCEAQLSTGQTDPDSFCNAFGTGDKLTLACFGFPGTAEP